MISPNAQTNLANAKIISGDYYSQGKETTGTLFAKGGEALDLRGLVQEEQFLAIAEKMDWVW
jgi:hypothetical protein